MKKILVRATSLLIMSATMTACNSGSSGSTTNTAVGLSVESQPQSNVLITGVDNSPGSVQVGTIKNNPIANVLDYLQSYYSLIIYKEPYHIGMHVSYPQDVIQQALVMTGQPGISFNDTGTAVVSTINYADGDPTFMGNNTLINNSNISQNLTTSSFSTTATRTSSTTTAHGWSEGTTVEASGKVGIPFVAEGGIKITQNVSFNGSSSKTITDTTSNTVTATQQNITVPAQSTAFVNVYLNNQTATGTIIQPQIMQLTEYVVVSIVCSPGFICPQQPTSTVYLQTSGIFAFQDIFPLADGVSYNAQNNTIAFNALIDFNVAIATNYTVNVQIVSNVTHKKTKNYSYKAQLTN